MGLDSAAAQDVLPRASMLIDLGRHEEAIRLLHDVLRQDPESSRAHCLLSLAYLRLERPKEAMAEARRVLARNPDDEWPHRLLSSGLLRSGKKREALQEAQESVRLAPLLPQALMSLIHAQIAVKDFAAAAETGAQLLAVAPEAAVTHLHLGNLAFARKEWRAAEECYRRSLAINPQSSDTLCNLGLALHMQHKSVDAFDHLYTAVRLNPQYDDAQRALYAAIEGYLTPLRLSGMGVPSGLIYALAIIPQTRAILLLVYLLNNTVVRWWRTHDLPPEIRRFHKLYSRTHRPRRRRVVRILLILLVIMVILVLALALVGTIWHVSSRPYGPVLPAWTGVRASAYM